MTPPFPLLTQARRMPLVAILRGLVPAEAADIGHALYENGFRTLEVPLNRPDAIECIGRHQFSDFYIVGQLQGFEVVGLVGQLAVRNDVHAVLSFYGRA